MFITALLLQEGKQNRKLLPKILEKMGSILPQRKRFCLKPFLANDFMNV